MRIFSKKNLPQKIAIATSSYLKKKKTFMWKKLSVSTFQLYVYGYYKLP